MTRLCGRAGWHAYSDNAIYNHSVATVGLGVFVFAHRQNAFRVREAFFFGVSPRERG